MTLGMQRKNCLTVEKSPPQSEVNPANKKNFKNFWKTMNKPQMFPFSAELSTELFHTLCFSQVKLLQPLVLSYLLPKKTASSQIPSPTHSN